jgi:hypothetical protein
MHFHFRYDTMSEAEFGISCSIYCISWLVVGSWVDGLSSESRILTPLSVIIYYGVMMTNNNALKTESKPARESFRVQYPFEPQKCFVTSAERASLPPVGG